MKKTRSFLLGILCSLILIQSIFLMFIPTVKAEFTIPSEYYQELDPDSIYIYNVTKFGGTLNWFGFDYVSKYNTTSNNGGQIRVNFTGFYDKHPNDIYNAFGSPMSYMDIEFLENNAGVLNSNHTFNNVSNGEAAFNMALGYNGFQSGFLIPIENYTYMKELALAQDSGFMPGDITIEESFNFISFDFKQDSKFQNTTLVYEKQSGLLIWAKTKLAPITDPVGYTLEMFLTNYSLDFDTTFSYNVSKFNSAAFWYDWDYSYVDTWTTNPGGIVNVSFTGYYFKDPDDLASDSFPSNIKRAWLNIDIFYDGYFGPIGPQISLNNISNREAAIQMSIGFGEMQTGFIIPSINNLSLIRQLAMSTNPGEIKLTEKILTIEFDFSYEVGGFIQNTHMIYEKVTGLLQLVDTTAGEYSLAMKLIGFPVAESETPSTPVTSIASYDILILSLIVFVSSLILIKKFKLKIMK